MVYVVAMESAINVQLWGWNPHVLVKMAGPVTIANVLPPKYQTSNVQIRKLTRFVLEEVMLIILDVNAYQELTQFETNPISIFHDYAPALVVAVGVELLRAIFHGYAGGLIFMK